MIWCVVYIYNMGTIPFIICDLICDMIYDMICDIICGINWYMADSSMGSPGSQNEGRLVPYVWPYFVGVFPEI